MRGFVEVGKAEGPCALIAPDEAGHGLLEARQPPEGVAAVALATRLIEAETQAGGQIEGTLKSVEGPGEFSHLPVSHAQAVQEEKPRERLWVLRSETPSLLDEPDRLLDPAAVQSERGEVADGLGARIGIRGCMDQIREDGFSLPCLARHPEQLSFEEQGQFPLAARNTLFFCVS